MNKFTLLSHALCPYVQRAAITLAEKSVSFERITIDLAQKPEWFQKVSPLGKTPVLLVNEKPIFESTVICEYLDDVFEPKLHPLDPYIRAQHRAWMEFASVLLNSIWRFYTATTQPLFDESLAELAKRLSQIEEVIGEGPYFDGPVFRMIDAVYAPVFRYFQVFEQLQDFGFFTDLPKVRAWRAHLLARPSVRDAVNNSYAEELAEYVESTKSVLGRQFKQASANPMLTC